MNKIRYILRIISGCNGFRYFIGYSGIRMSINQLKRVPVQDVAGKVPPVN